MKLLIIGVPRAGKTTRAIAIQQQYVAGAEAIGQALLPIHHTDKMITQYEWSVFSDKVCDMLKQPGPWIIEGCSAVRGLRKYLKEGNKPDFEIEWLDKVYIPHEGRQKGFAASLVSIWKECQDAITALDLSK